MTRTVEICIPVRNEEQRIESVLCALSAQSFKDFAVHIYDNASDDRTVDLARGFQGALDLKICTRTRNIGQNSNINSSFANCTSPYIALLSGNDIVAENYLEVLLDRLEANPGASCAYAKQIQLDAEGGASAKQFCSSLTEDDAVDRACKSIAIYEAQSQFFSLYRRSVLERVQPQRFRFGGDNVMACEVALYGKVLYTDETSMTCSASPGSESSRTRFLHLVKLFSLDWQRGLPVNSSLGRFEQVTPTIDMFHAHLDMFRLADIPHEERERLVVHGARALLRRYGRYIDADIGHVIQVLRAIAELSPLGNLLGHVLLFHALQKANECLLLVHSSELIEIRERLSRLAVSGREFRALSAV